MAVNWNTIFGRAAVGFSVVVLEARGVYIIALGVLTNSFCQLVGSQEQLQGKGR